VPAPANVAAAPQLPASNRNPRAELLRRVFAVDALSSGRLLARGQLEVRFSNCHAAPQTRPAAVIAVRGDRRDRGFLARLTLCM
jgi:hypothetical protein